MPLGKVHVRIMLADNLNMSLNANRNEIFMYCRALVHGFRQKKIDNIVEKRSGRRILPKLFDWHFFLRILERK